MIFGYMKFNHFRHHNWNFNRIKLKKEGENLLKFFVEKRITQCQTELIHCQKLLLVFNKMLEVLEGYHYSQDEWMLLLQNAENQS